ncbi:MAG: imidazole glycerol phosphate synthase subunit HisF [Candidatus Fischerbacteria bacterium RBG_13_37_8]|uniref:Imidazole glycerol phosphate synthase subunit HisF n=1 Tax=Candidatus Fischerbacteria bacterium RBG_13_37_8 TaxID=1817863 RepID=A0A1F5VX43_9BACT|nr:MAG: imidazole glycerol phosphate synthase subunit HisF [Candidatus Fischerbacteria bacterium RBG_13_37_8]
MLAIRIIACLDIEEGKVVKGIKFKGIQDVGNPVEFARYYNEQEVDELVFLDIGASYKSKEILIDVVHAVSKEVFIPLTVGGGLRSIEDIRKVLNAGADKVALCTSAIENPALISEGAYIFGSQCIVLSIDAKRDGDSWYAFTRGGRHNSGLDAIEWAKKAEQLGAGEILLNSIDMDGTRAGYDIELTRKVHESVGIPVIASGGAGELKHMLDIINEGKADAVLIASLLHYREYTIHGMKKYLKENGVCVR